MLRPEDLHLFWYVCHQSSHDLRKELPNAVCHTLFHFSDCLWFLPETKPGHWCDPFCPIYSPLTPLIPWRVCGTLIIAPRVGTLVHSGSVSSVPHCSSRRRRQTDHYSSESSRKLRCAHSTWKSPADALSSSCESLCSSSCCSDFYILNLTPRIPRHMVLNFSSILYFKNCFPLAYSWYT